MSELPEVIECDVLIIGCGIAGATTALQLAEKEEDCHITLITKADNALESNTYHAQGGIIYRGDEDSPEKLAEDIIRAGDGLNNRRAVEILATEGPRRVRELLLEKYDVPFSVDEEGLDLTSEAAHSTSRILHANDATGKAIQEKLAQALHEHPNIQLLRDHVAVDLLTPSHHSQNRLAIYEPLSCVGAYVFDCEASFVRTILAKATVLATGGIGEIFLHTTNPHGATGDGLAMAHRAGARIINAEYVQFHPTAFYHRGQARFLVSESLRGEGAHLLNIDGEPFMHRYAPEWKELAPRDVVARSIHEEMLHTGAPHVYLDLASAMAPEKIAERFPTICQRAQEYGVDPTTELIPVVPAAHYFCGGVWVDEWGRTNLEHLYAVGEVSCTGAHGANRLGSASMLEGLVWGERAARDIRRNISGWERIDAQDIPQWKEEGVINHVDPVLIEHDMVDIKHTMWYYVGLVRTQRRLERALRDLNNLRQDIDAFYRTTRLSPEIISLRNATLSAIIVAEAAWENRESHGCHYRED